MRIVNPERLDAAVRAIESGELVVVPTSRWYMVCAAANNDDLCRKIFSGKRRPNSKPLVYVAPSLASCGERFALTGEARSLAEAFWPGDLALLLPWRAPEDAAAHRAVGSPALVTVAPGILGEFARRARIPIAATTANISGDADPGDRGPAITAQEVADFAVSVGLPISVTVDGGICPAANHMTIVDCFVPEARLVRTGLVHQRALNAALNRPIES
ncbi:L-threonylcarbamoyladenylate synthase [Actinomadura sp. BRA 177]|uniref:L-threonylcarbamoyladenylate synthase n=1 Tax=Actinomadura sp. BRA 177 TaxID=2745202 RepID=UPI0015955CB0|nr:Sua5/YciO/YrdC/YwlC family protein [Actinomadura sp. BRA 177]NVI89329.1 Sua5/YciO/YrdC/YwlC family protein [Actinomadura sp. BRA 177]